MNYFSDPSFTLYQNSLLEDLKKIFIKYILSDETVIINDDSTTNKKNTGRLSACL